MTQGSCWKVNGCAGHSSGWLVVKGAARDLAEVGVLPEVRGREVVEEAENEMGMRFSRDKIEVDFVKRLHVLVGGSIVSRQAIFSFICVRGFLW